MPNERRFSDLSEATDAFVRDLADHLRRSVDARGTASLALSGGRTPERVLPLLAKADLPWSAVSVTLTDERWVSADHPDSNEGLARRLFLKGAAGDAAFLGLYTGDRTPWAGQAACEARLARFPSPIDAVFLGMGADGHIASLFPGETALAVYPDCSSRCVAVSCPQGSVSRMSLSPCTLLAARHLFLFLSGGEKLATYEAARKPGPLSELPLRLVIHQDHTPLTVFIAP